MITMYTVRKLRESTTNTVEQTQTTIDIEYHERLENLLLNKKGYRPCGTWDKLISRYLKQYTKFGESKISCLYKLTQWVLS